MAVLLAVTAVLVVWAHRLTIEVEVLEGGTAVIPPHGFWRHTLWQRPPPTDH